MSKDITKRISYYTRKVAEKSAIHPSKALPKHLTHRNERLKLYKKLMHDEIERNSRHESK